MSGTDLVKARTAGLMAPDDVKALAAEYGTAGMEDMGQDDRSTPFIVLLQKLSPQVDKRSEKHVAGAEEGDLLNTVTGETYKNDEGGATVVPVVFQKTWTVWKPRDEGGGFLGSYADPELSKPIFVPPSAAAYDGPQQVVETAQHWALVQSKDGGFAPAIINLKSTQLRVSRTWNTLTTLAAQKWGVPVFARQYRLTSVVQQNDKGTFMNLKVEDAGFAPADAIKMAAAFRGLVKTGALKADLSKSGEAEASQADTTQAETGGPKF